MKTIAEQFFGYLVGDIIKEKQDIAEKEHKQFNGVNGSDLVVEIEKHLGKGWVVAPPQKLSVEDVNAIANARFFKQTGQKLLMGMTIVILGLAVVARYLTLTPLGINIFYTIFGMVALSFIWVYTRKQAKNRKEFHWKWGVKDTEEK
jgi:hypothetical protein